MAKSETASFSERAFTVIEILAVLSILSVLVVCFGWGLRHRSSGAARQIAVSSLLNTLENARVQALASGFSTGVVFYLSKDTGAKDSYAIMQKDPASHEFVRIGRWEKLPVPVSFYPWGNSLLKGPKIAAVPPGEEAKTQLPALIFDSAGMVEEPLDSSLLKIVIFEGNREMRSKDEFSWALRPQAEVAREEILIRPLTGKAEHHAE